MIMGKRYQRGRTGERWKKRVRVFQFFSLTQPRDCVFLAERRTIHRSAKEHPSLSPASRPRADFAFRFVSRSNDSPERRRALNHSAPKHIFPSSFPRAFLPNLLFSPLPLSHFLFLCEQGELIFSLFVLRQSKKIVKEWKNSQRCTRRDE